MDTRSLILKVLTHEPVTTTQICRQVEREWKTSNETPRTRMPRARGIEQSLRNLVSSGYVVTSRTPDGLVRFALPEPQYRCDNLLDTWSVWRKHPHVAGDETCIARNMSEAEARMTVSTLNEMNRKAREIRGGL